MYVENSIKLFQIPTTNKEISELIDFELENECFKSIE